MAVEIQQIVIRANASETGTSDKKKSGKEDCKDKDQANNAQKMANMVSTILKNEKER